MAPTGATTGAPKLSPHISANYAGMYNMCLIWLFHIKFLLLLPYSSAQSPTVSFSSSIYFSLSFFLSFVLSFSTLLWFFFWFFMPSFLHFLFALASWTSSFPLQASLPTIPFSFLVLPLVLNVRGIPAELCAPTHNLWTESDCPSCLSDWRNLTYK